MSPVTHPDSQLAPVGLLALCPLIAGSGTLTGAACMALGFLVMLVAVSTTMAMLGRLVASEFRVLMIFLVSGIWVTAFDLILEAVAYPLSQELHPSVPVLAANSLVLAVGEHSLRGSSDPVESLRRSARLGLQAACWVIPLGLVREVVGTGALFSDSYGMSWMPGPALVLPAAMPALAYPMWGFLLFALLAAAVSAAAHRPGIPTP